MDIFKFEVELDIMLIFKPDNQLLHEEKIKGFFCKISIYIHTVSSRIIKFLPNPILEAQFKKQTFVS